MANRVNFEDLLHAVWWWHSLNPGEEAVNTWKSWAAPVADLFFACADTHWHDGNGRSPRPSNLHGSFLVRPGPMARREIRRLRPIHGRLRER